MRVLIYGNSGSGKSTRAKALAAQHHLVHLDLDTLVWEPGQIAVARPADAVRADLDAFLARETAWVIEGCYGECVAHAAAHCTQLVFLDPGLEACLANNRRRQWEPHKYASKEEQDAMLPVLKEWVAGYYTRKDDWSHAAHQRIYEAHPGNKERITA